MNLNPFSLKDKVIIITGASSGIGRQCAITCSQMDAKVILIARNKVNLEATINQMDNPDIHKIIPMDVTDFSKIEAVISEIVNEVGKVSGFIHSAGIEETIPFNIIKYDNFQRLFDVNFYSALEFARCLSKIKFHVENNLSLVFISSLAAQCGQKGLVAYSSSKAALTGAVKSMSVELAQKKIRINTIEPGWIKGTEMTNKYEENDEERILMYPLGYGKPEDVANACIYLLSEAGCWITGTNLIVDGGYLAK